MALGMRERSSTSSCRWSGMVGQDLAGPPDESAGRLVAGSGDDADVGQQLVAGQSADRAGLVLELGLEEIGHDVVGGVVGPPVDILAEDVGGDEVLGHLHGLTGLSAQVGVDPVADGLLVLFGDAEQHADDPHGHLCAEVGDEVEPSAPTSGSRLRAQNSRICGSSAATRFGENTRDISRRWMVCTGGSSKMSTPEGMSMLALISSMMPPRPEMNVLLSRRPRSTSSNRLRAKKSWGSL